MTSVNVVSPASDETTTVELPDAIFAAKINVPLMHQVVVAQRAAARQGTHATKTRGMVSGGGRKPYRQKGTGRARQGSTRAPQFTGGGVAHGPQPRDYTQRTPKKMKAAALRGALSDRAASERVYVVTNFVESDVPKTREALAVLDTVTGGATKNILVVTLRDHDLVHQGHVHLGGEDRVRQLDGAGLLARLARRRDDVDAGHRVSSRTAERTMTSPPRGPGTAPLISSRFLSLSTACTVGSAR